MAEKQSKNQGEGLISKVLFPGYADSGASTAFQAFRPNRDPTNENEDTNQKFDDEEVDNVDCDDDNDKVSEATTALHDNRTMMAKSFISDSVSTTPQNGVRAEFNSKYGFFPTTKPPQISPRPASPPTVTRRQLPIAKDTFSVAGTSGIPETGGSLDVHLQSITIERQNQNQLTEYDYESNKGSLPISKNGNDDEDKAGGNEEQMMESSSSHSRSTCTQNSSLGRGERFRETSLEEDDDVDNLDLSAENDRLSEVPSDVLSTASEMGTVINIGSDRMAEIDAMAALAESSPAEYSDNDSRSTTSKKTNQDLSLPVLEAQTTDPTLPLPKNALKQSTSLEKNMNFVTGTREKSPTTSEMVSKAIRRIGPALNQKNSISAPTTPRTPGLQLPRVEDLLKSTLTPHSSTSFAMKSPGSSSRQAMRTQATATTTLTPRFTSTKSPSWLQQQQSTPRSMDYVVSDDLLLPQCNDSAYEADMITKSPLKDDHSKTKQTTSSAMSPIDPSLLLPVRLAQRCFSFDSTLDELNSSNNPNYNHSGNVRILPRVDERQKQKQPIRSSQSWDFVRSQVEAPAFRPAPHQLKFGPILRNTKSQDEHARTRVDSDFSPTKMDPNSAIELKTPQRIEIEREDALDILACLVERGVTEWKTTKEPILPASASPSAATVDFGPRNESIANEFVGNPISDSMIETTAEEFRKWSQEIPIVDADNGAHLAHSMHMAVLDELLRAHAYALEMKRASLSASSWLKSIGRFDNEHSMKTTTGADGAPNSSSGGQASGEAIDRNLKGTSKMEVMTLNARLHRADMELKDKTEANEKLNMELSKCKAEIGRLRNTTRNEHSHHSYNNRSILDDSNEEETCSTGGLKGYGKDDHPSPIPPSYSHGKFFDQSFNGNSSIFQGASGDETNHQFIGETSRLDIFVMKSALEEANKRIRRLHEQLQEKNLEGETNPSAPTVDITEVSVKVPNREEGGGGGRASPTSSLDKDFHRTVNVKMLDGENFVTDWNPSPPLPPPPDHGIRSPIVSAVLEQWTSDQSLHESLIRWIERVMTEQDIDGSVRPLTISSLDHQVRDGFAMHVLPLLLRRADIHVSVQTRAHRTTKYDMSVTVSQKSYHQSSDVSTHAASLLDHYVGEEWLQNKADESRLPSSGESTFGASHSAVTEKAFNRSQFLRNHPAEMEQYSNFPRQRSGSDSVEEQQTGSIMSALGGALGGLLSRRKFSAETSPSSEGYYGDALRSSMPAEMRAQMDLTSSPVHGSFPKEEDQPYHRVVSAPPGRIGVTFVEFRGHAMVSDVAPDGPLSSWVFPSDILIAIDEIPVSGMRVRNIIKVLTERRGRQRNLRVISSHAMTEFTLNSSTLNGEDDTD